MSEIFNITIPAYYKYIKIFKDVTEGIMRCRVSDENEIYLVKLAVAEATTNIIKHSYCGECNEEINLKVMMEGNKIEFLIRDFGKKVEIKDIKSRELDNYKENGLGVHIIKSVMKSVEYRHMKVGTLLIMSKEIGEELVGIGK